MKGISASAALAGRQAASASLVLADDAAAGVAQDVLEQDLDRHRQRARDRSRPARSSR
jgi:hypothetical protein